jgi:hypothetical protein
MSEYKIALRDITKNVVDYTQVSAEDYTRVNKHRWYRSQGNKHEIVPKHYARSVIDGRSISMHHFLLGKPTKGFIVDHIDGDGLNNRRDNLRTVTLSQNGQNRRLHNKASKTSRYIGVSSTKSNTWVAFCRNKNLGTFKKEIDAAIRYDNYVMKVYGRGALCNNLVNYDDVKGKAICDFLPPKRKGDLPQHIYSQNQKFFARITYKGKTHRSHCVDSVNDALALLQTFQTEIEELMNVNNSQVCNHTTIDRNIDGIACINLKDESCNIDHQVMVDDDIWYALQQYKLYYTKGYACITKDNKPLMVHKYIMGKCDGYIIDHINRNKLDNRKSNLRFTDYSGNNHNHNKRKNGTSIYKGVTKRAQKWYASVRKEHVKYYLGAYEEEVMAAIAYNIKAKELYGCLANLNVVPKEQYAHYEKAITEKIRHDEHNIKKIILKYQKMENAFATL